MALKRLGLVHTALVGSAVAPEAARLLQLGRMRGGPTVTGGFFIEIEGNGQTRRAEMTPREAVTMSKQILECYGVKIELDLGLFRHVDG